MTFVIHQGNAGDVLSTIPAASVQCCVTSPPYWGLRDYGVDGQIGLEETPEQYIAQMIDVFSEVWRVLRDDGTLWLNLGDSYAGSGKGPSNTPKQASNFAAAEGLKDARRNSSQFANGQAPSSCIPIPSGLKPKDLVGIPWRVAFALQAEGWYLRSDIIWHKANPMPESVTDRPTKAHEYVFLLSKSERYYYDADSLREPATDTGRINGRDGREEPESARPPGTGPRTLKRLDYSQLGRNKRSVWTLATQPTPDAHFATFPIELPELCIRAGCPEGGTVLDPFAGAGTTGLAAIKNGREFVGIELNPEYIVIAHNRLNRHYPLFAAADPVVESNAPETKSRQFGLTVTGVSGDNLEASPAVRQHHEAQQQADAKEPLTA